MVLKYMQKNNQLYKIKHIELKNLIQSKHSEVIEIVCDFIEQLSLENQKMKFRLGEIINLAKQ